MGCGPSVSAEEKEARRQNKDLDEEIRKQTQADAEKVKLLLLGAGESGKSTIFKQIKLLHGKAPSDDEMRRNWNPVVHSNILTFMRTLLEQTKNQVNVMRARVPLVLKSYCFVSSDSVPGASCPFRSVRRRRLGHQRYR